MYTDFLAQINLLYTLDPFLDVWGNHISQDEYSLKLEPHKIRMLDPPLPLLHCWTPMRKGLTALVQGRFQKSGLGEGGGGQT